MNIDMDKIYNAISKHYEKQGKETIDIVYSIVNEMWIISVTERYTQNSANGRRVKIRVVEERMTDKQVEELVGLKDQETFSKEEKRYIIESLNLNIQKHESLIDIILNNKDINDNIRQVIIKKIKVIDNIIDKLEREI